MGTLAEKLHDVSKELPDCSVARLLVNMHDQEDRVALESALASAASTRSIHRVLREAGYSIDRANIGIHRENRCRCNQGEKQ